MHRRLTSPATFGHTGFNSGRRDSSYALAASWALAQDPTLRQAAHISSSTPASSMPASASSPNTAASSGRPGLATVVVLLHLPPRRRRAHTHRTDVRILSPGADNHFRHPQARQDTRPPQQRRREAGTARRAGTLSLLSTERARQAPERAKHQVNGETTALRRVGHESLAAPGGNPTEEPDAKQNSAQARTASWSATTARSRDAPASTRKAPFAIHARGRHAMSEWRAGL